MGVSPRVGVEQVQFFCNQSAFPFKVRRVDLERTPEKRGRGEER